MDLQRFIKMVAGWALAWFLFAGLMGMFAGLLGVPIPVWRTLLVYGALPGVVGGLLFTTSFQWFAPRLRAATVRATAATATGIATGMITALAFFWAFVGRDDLAVGMAIWAAQGGVTGLCCGLTATLPRTRPDPH